MRPKPSRLERAVDKTKKEAWSWQAASLGPCPAPTGNDQGKLPTLLLLQNTALLKLPSCPSIMIQMAKTWVPGEETHCSLPSGGFGGNKAGRALSLGSVSFSELRSNEPDLSGLTQPDMGQVLYLGVQD